MSRDTGPITIGPERYTAWRARTLGKITEAIEQRLILELMGDLEHARVLDAGCGDGTLACAAARRGAVVTGVDPDPAMRAAARARAASAAVHAVFSDGRIERLPLPDACYDVVVAITVLCFVAEPAAALRELRRVLRLGGRLVLGELGRFSLWALIRRVRGWCGDATWAAVRFRSAGELRALAEQAGLRVTAIRGAVFYPPLGLCARVLAPIDPWLGRLTSIGAAFVALAAVRPPNMDER